MAKPFKLTPHQARQQARDLDTKDQLIAKTQKAMNLVLRDGIEQVYASYVKTGRYKEPNLEKMYGVSESFYREIVKAAVKSCQRQDPKKKLAAIPQGDLPDGPAALDKVLKNRRYWRQVIARSKYLTKKAKQAYLDRLKKQFKKILPILELGDMSPKEVKNKIAEAWNSGKARTETIFRTEATRYFATSQVKYFEGSSLIIGFLFDSVRDTSRTNWCRSRHGLVYRPDTTKLELNTPPCHWNCRSHLIPLVDDKENREMLKDPARDPDKVKVVPLPTGWKN